MWQSAHILCCLIRPADLGPVSWRLTTVKWRQFSQSNRQYTISTQQTEYHEALPSSVNDDEMRCDCTFTDDRNTSWYLVCRWWNDGLTVKTVVTWWSSASLVLAPVFIKSSVCWMSLAPHKCSAYQCLQCLLLLWNSVCYHYKNKSFALPLWPVVRHLPWWQ